MNTGTRVEFLDSGCEMHTNTRTRYFNGREYTTITTHHFMTRPTLSWEKGDKHYWLWLTHYTCLTTTPFAWPTWRSYRSRSVSTGNKPSVLQGTIDAMVPDDMQAVPF